MRESEKYYNVPNWILYIGGGFTPRTGILAIIYSFCKDSDGNLTGQCKAGIDFFVERVGCSRREVFRQMKYLCDAGYIKRLAKRNKAQTAFFIMIAERCEQAKQAYDAQSQADGAAYDTQSQENAAQEPSCATVAHENAAQEPESARARGEFVAIPEYPNIKLTTAELAKLKKMQFPTRRRPNLNAYFQALEDAQASGKKYTNHFRTLTDWIEQDTPKAGAAPAAGDPAQGSSQRSSSIDDADLEKVFPGRGSCTG